MSCPPSWLNEFQNRRAPAPASWSYLLLTGTGAFVGGRRVVGRTGWASETGSMWSFCLIQQLRLTLRNQAGMGHSTCLASPSPPHSPTTVTGERVGGVILSCAGLETHTPMSDFMLDRGSKLRYSCLSSRHFTNSHHPSPLSGVLKQSVGFGHLGS